MGLIGTTIRLKSGYSMQVFKADKNGIYVGNGIGKPSLIYYDNVIERFNLDETQLKSLEEEKNSHKTVIKARKAKSPKANVVGTENIAFKVNYCDGGETDLNFGFRGICSNDCRNRNVNGNDTNWCHNSLCRKLYDGKAPMRDIDDAYKQKTLCYESNTLVDWKAFAGEDIKNGTHKPRRIVNLAPKSIAVLTTVLPGTDKRVIFGLFYVEKGDQGDENTTGYVEANTKYRIEFTKDEANQLDFWEFYSNKNPKNMSWGSGLFRYLSNEQVLAILKAGLKAKNGKHDYDLLKELIDLFRKEKNI